MVVRGSVGGHYALKQALDAMGSARRRRADLARNCTRPQLTIHCTSDEQSLDTALVCRGSKQKALSIQHDGDRSGSRAGGARRFSARLSIPTLHRRSAWRRSGQGDAAQRASAAGEISRHPASPRWDTINVASALSAGGDRGWQDLHEARVSPFRLTATHDWAIAQGASFTDAGQWKRAQCFPVRARRIGSRADP